ncbi:carbohydrate kinase family protein [Candidatus Saccharibacteria bacterium]|nr:carbohydrate kinase family protein [Candidatus Saccharibacteria bacterium]
MSQKQLDVLAVGDVVTDVFIKLLKDEVKVIKDKNDSPWLSMPFASKVPFDHAEVIPAVGNAGNASVAFAKLEFDSGLITNVGGDEWGREIMTALREADVDTRFVHVNPGKKSNYHYVLWYKEDRTILIKHEEYAYHWPSFRVIDIPKWIYFSSVSQHALEYHDQIVAWLESHPPVKLAFQPGTFQIEAGVKRLRKLYERSELLAVNREEATVISGGDRHDIHDLLDRLHDLGPKIVVISDGHAGAYASDGVNRYKMPIYPDPKPPFERTGAGDAFSATFVAAIMRGADIQGALLWAPINAMSVVQKVGAQAGLLSVRQVEQYLRSAPRWYHPERIR